ncbi:hypothetical protein ABZT26_25785 [Streptomyces sp. NPDC005395]|uniref:hypothetical protein n=1 Tax=Streptomyces sp. NPDC005395 TaxID=3157042 RepID=UPI0033BA6284
MEKIMVGSVLVFEARGEKRSGRVIGLYSQEEIAKVTRKALVFTPEGPATIAVPIAEAAYAADQKERSLQDRQRAAAYLEDSAWYPGLDEGAERLMTEVFLDCLEYEHEQAPTKSAFSVALEWDHVLRQVLMQHHQYAGARG